MYLEQNSRSITLEIHASTVEHPPHFNSHLNHLLEVAQALYWSIFRIEATETYPQPNGGQN